MRCYRPNNFSPGDLIVPASEGQVVQSYRVIAAAVALLVLVLIASAVARLLF